MAVGCGEYHTSRMHGVHRYGMVLSTNFTMTFPYQGNRIFQRWVLDTNVHGCGVIVHDFTGFHNQGREIPSSETLSPGARRILELPNAGGNSVWSEVMSFEVIRCMFNCKLAYTEMELAYFPYGSSITDYSVNVHTSDHARDMISLGVSVTRAMAYNKPFTEADAERLMNKKLYGVTNSTRCVMKNMRWRKQILHVWVQEAYMMPILLDAYFRSVDMETRSNTLVLFTVSNNARYLYQNEEQS